MKANRIQELAEQCRIETYGVNGELLASDFDEQKFAELIIAECAKLCEPAAQPEPVMDYDKEELRGTVWDTNKQSLAQPEQEPWLLESTQTLAKTLARKFYPEVTQWKCLNDLVGVILQIDNMITGLIRKSEQDWEGIAADQALTIALMKSEQEPVDVETVYETIIKWDEGGGKRSRRELTRRIVELYTSPPKREWVGLTDDERRVCTQSPFTEENYRAIEAKLKELNHD
jgi:hypothetical protein